jgi:hypothetical protein
VQMAEKYNATCSICGDPYYVCMSCKDSMKLHPYKIHCCSADCYKTFQVVRGFSTGVYTKDEFKSKLRNIDLSNLENYVEHIKVLIKDTLKEDKSIVEAYVEKDNATEEKVIIEKPIYSRKRNYKVEAE